MELQKHPASHPSHPDHRAFAVKQRTYYNAPSNAVPESGLAIEQVLTHEEPVRAVIEQVIPCSEVDVQLTPDCEFTEIDPTVKLTVHDCLVYFICQVLVGLERFQLMPRVRSPTSSQPPPASLSLP